MGPDPRHFSLSIITTSGILKFINISLRGCLMSWVARELTILACANLENLSIAVRTTCLHVR